jgi:hypothetical protein
MTDPERPPPIPEPRDSGGIDHERAVRRFRLPTRENVGVRSARSGLTGPNRAAAARLWSKNNHF